VVCLDTDWGDYYSAKPGTLRQEWLKHNLLQALLVSRRVQIAHRAVVNFLNSMRQEPGLTNQDVPCGYHILRYCRTGTLLPLIVGARIVLVSREVALMQHSC